jgi:hypothetical protein
MSLYSAVPGSFDGLDLTQSTTSPLQCVRLKVLGEHKSDGRPQDRRARSSSFV